MPTSSRSFLTFLGTPSIPSATLTFLPPPLAESVLESGGVRVPPLDEAVLVTDATHGAVHALLWDIDAGVAQAEAELVSELSEGDAVGAPPPTLSIRLTHDVTGRLDLLYFVAHLTTDYHFTLCVVAWGREGVVRTAKCRHLLARALGEVVQAHGFTEVVLAPDFNDCALPQPHNTPVKFRRHVVWRDRLLALVGFDDLGHFFFLLDPTLPDVCPRLPPMRA